jgi:hypothetical protein
LRGASEGKALASVARACDLIQSTTAATSGREFGLALISQ